MISKGGRAGDCDNVEILGRLVASVIHDVNNPLGIALAKTQIALRLVDQSETSHEELKDCLDRTAASIRRAAGVIRDLRVLMRNPLANTGLFDVHSLIRAVRTVTHGDAQLMNCDVVVETELQPVLIEADALELLLALSSVVWDAIDTGARHVTLSIDKSEPGDRVSIWIVALANQANWPPSNSSSALARCIEGQGGRVELLPSESGKSAICIELPTSNMSYQKDVSTNH